MHLPAALLALVACAVSSHAATDQQARFAALAAKRSGVIPLNSKLFDDITSTPRNYSVSIALTALPGQYKCEPCRIFDREMRLVANSWKASRQRDDHFFAVLDFPDGHETFRRLGLQTAPNIRYFPPTEGARATGSAEPELFDVLRLGPSAEAFATWIRNTAKIPLSFRRPPDYSKLGAVLSSSLTLVAAIWQFWPYFKRFVLGKEIWAVATNLLILLMTSGYMWNQIRTPPFLMPGANGQVSYIAAGYQNQYGIETQIVATIYAILAFSVYTLAVTIPWMADPWRQRVTTYIWSGVLFVMANALILVFKAKSPGYPFSLGLF